MAEAVAVVSLVASILQLVDFGSQLLKRIDDCISASQEVPPAFRAGRLQLPSAINTLRSVLAQAQRSNVSSSDAQALIPLIESSLALTKTLTATLDKTIPTGVSSTIRKGFMAVKNFKYDKKVQRTVQQLQSNIQILIFHQATHHSDLANEICLKLQHLRLPALEATASLYTKPTPSRVEKADMVGSILAWLRAVDMEGIRREKERSPGTCEWIKAQETFVQWHKFMVPRCLWVRGIPGKLFL